MREGRYLPGRYILTALVTPTTRSNVEHQIRALVPDVFIFTHWTSTTTSTEVIAARLVSISDYDIAKDTQLKLKQTSIDTRFTTTHLEPPDVASAEVLTTYGATTAARVAVTRSFDRLVQRGLATRRSSGVDLTPEGVHITIRLLANNRNNVQLVSQ